MKRAILLLLMFFPTFSFAIDPSTMAKQLQTHFNIFTLKEEWRSPQDQVVVTGNESSGYVAEISYWHSLQQRDPAAEICEAYRWILFGKGTYGQGADAAFKKYPSLSKVILKLFDVIFDTKRGEKKGDIVPLPKPIKYLELVVERKSLMAKTVNWEALKGQMNKSTCPDYGAKYIDSRWFEQKYLREGKKG